MPFIQVQDVEFSYPLPEGQAVKAIDRISLRVPAGEYLAVLGRNGSGKSTLAKLLNGLELPDRGRILIAGTDTREDHLIFEVRRRCGMVFQNPDNQIVGTTVEEDVAFGPENLGIPLPELAERVEEALQAVGLASKAEHLTATLSGGQKQKLAIAGILAMQPDCIILDEATSMLDPLSRNEFLTLISDLRRERNLTVINITHDMQEARLAERCIILDEGRVVADGPPSGVFHHVDLLRSLGLDVPFSTAVAVELAQLLDRPLTEQDTASPERCATTVKNLLQNTPLPAALAKKTVDGTAEHLPKAAADPVIVCRQLSYRYENQSLQLPPALQDVSFTVERGEVFGIMGHTGSGKSTLVQHLNALLRLQSGQLSVLGHDLSKVSEIRTMRPHVGLLFQYPEHQLFAETVAADIAFGPKRLGLSAAEVTERVAEAADLVGFDPEVLQKSPFELSGGQKRRAALAGILAMRPQVLVLDEPAAGLDPQGKAEMFSYIRQLRQTGVTIILVSHNMDDLANHADRILVLQEGRVRLCGRPEAVFADAQTLADCGLSLPAGVRFLQHFTDIYPRLNVHCYSPEAAVQALLHNQRQQAGGGAP